MFDKPTRQRDEKYRAWIRLLPCLVNGDGARCFGPIQAAHVRSRGAGGGDFDNLMPLCMGHHAEQHAVGIRTFAARYEVDLEAEAALLTSRWRKSR